MNLDIKVCPFRKQINQKDVQRGLGHYYEEDFLECLEEKCMAWSKKEKSCLLTRLEKKEEK